MQPPVIGIAAWRGDHKDEKEHTYLSKPDGAAPRGQITLSPKTILNIHTDLSGLWTWGVEESFVPANIVRTIVQPDPKAPVVETLTKADEHQNQTQQPAGLTDLRPIYEAGKTGRARRDRLEPCSQQPVSQRQRR
jgi:hypothetical protein